MTPANSASLVNAGHLSSFLGGIKDQKSQLHFFGVSSAADRNKE